MKLKDGAVCVCVCVSLGNQYYVFLPHKFWKTWWSKTRVSPISSASLYSRTVEVSIHRNIPKAL